MKELDDIAKEAAEELLYAEIKSHAVFEAIIRAAIDKALEYALMREPSEGQCRALYDAQSKIASLLHRIEFAPFEKVAGKSGMSGLDGLKDPIRYVTAKLLEELKERK